MYSPLGSMMFPDSSMGFSIVNTARMCAIAIHMVSMAKWRPTQLRLPKPKTGVASAVSMLNCSSEARYRVGSNLSGFGYRVASWQIALRGHCQRNTEYRCSE